MKVLIVETESPRLRAEIYGWGHEDASLFVEGKPIGLTPGPHSCRGLRALSEPDPFWNPETVLEALYRGWKLLGPPQKEEWHDEDGKRESWTWWLTKE